MYDSPGRRPMHIGRGGPALLEIRQAVVGHRT